MCCFNQFQLRKVHSHSHDQCVPLLLMAYRTSIHETTGCTPAMMMMMGRDLRLPIDLIFGRTEEEPSTGAILTTLSPCRKDWSWCTDSREMQSDWMKEYYDSHNLYSHKLGNGDAVWLYNPRRKKGISPKLQRSWEGPYVIIKKINDLMYQIQLGPRTKTKVVHRNRLWLHTYSTIGGTVRNLSNAEKSAWVGCPATLKVYW